jgi:predicted O-methyltransferase YrrM
VTPETRNGPAPLGPDHLDGFHVEDEVLLAARARGRELGAPGVSTGVGAALRFLATALAARAVVEIGTGCGVSGLCLLAGMAPDGVLTSIDIEPEHQRAAKRAFVESGAAPGRTRLIMGQALEVLPRLTDGGYDLVFVDATRAEYPRFHEHGVRLLRPGGVLAFAHALAGPPVDGRRDAESTALRDLARAVRDDDRLASVLLPVGDGLLAAARKPLR